MNDFTIARFVFLKLLALCALVAFASLLVQVDGLYASDGILPIAEMVARAQRVLGDGVSGWLDVPTLFRFGASDVQLHLAGWIGLGASALALLGFSTLPCLVVAFALYLSFVVAGGNFLSFQWDFLLLETLALGVLIAPGRVRPSRCADVAVSRIGLFPLWALLFHLMFASGVVKWRSSDGAWKHLEALRYHFETQPLPTALGWWSHQLPDWAKTSMCAAALAVEIVVPLAILAPRVADRARRAAAFAFIGLMVVIAATGNYTFFNLLTVALSVLLLDDGAWPAFMRRAFSTLIVTPPSRIRFAWLPLALVSIAMSASLSIGAFLPRRAPWPEPMREVESALARFGLSSRYGLFEDMTETRVELVVEGSDDGAEWKAYEFRWKPGDVARAPGLVAPHQPRLDWQMWFLPLSPRSQLDWFESLQEKLLAGEPSVTALLGSVPFAGHPPRWLRTHAFEYHFTTRAERAASGAWWTRTDLGFFGPTVELKDGRLSAAPPGGR